MIDQLIDGDSSDGNRSRGRTWKQYGVSARRAIFKFEPVFNPDFTGLFPL